MSIFPENIKHSSNNNNNTKTHTNKERSRKTRTRNRGRARYGSRTLSHVPDQPRTRANIYWNIWNASVVYLRFLCDTPRKPSNLHMIVPSPWCRHQVGMDDEWTTS